MAVYIIDFVVSCFIGLVFIVLGIRQCRSEAPAVMNTGEKPLKPEQLRDVKAWNTGHGKALIVFGTAIAFEIGTFPIILDYADAKVSTIILVVMVAAEIVGLEINHCRLERMYKIR